jgi:type II secretory pathway component GspD/PulD (secretin)
MRPIPKVLFSLSFFLSSSSPSLAAPSDASPPPDLKTANKLLVFHLRTIDVNTAAAAIDAFLAEARSRDDRVQVQTDEKTNAIIVSGSPLVLRQAKAFLSGLDQDGNSSAPFAPPEPVGK